MAESRSPAGMPDDNPAAFGLPPGHGSILTTSITASGALESLHPAYFAMVMATGILAIACKLLGLEPLPQILLLINGPAYAVLWVLTALRLLRYPRSVVADLRSHQRGPGFFTMVAATSVVGVQCALQLQALETATI